MKKAIVVAIVLGIGGLLAYRHFATPQRRTCARVGELCGLKSSDVDKCVDRVASLRASAGDQRMARLVDCTANAKSCAEGSGCLLGAGLGAATGAVGDFFKGLGGSLELS